MPRQLIQPFEVLYDILGTQPAAGGSVACYEIGTTTPKTTYADYDLTIPNENPVPLDSSGRISTPIWGDGEYTLVIRNADNETIKTLESRPEQPTGTALPPLNPGEFLTGDGTNYLAELIRQVSDPTGSAGAIYTTDGSNHFWASPASVLAGLIPEVPDPEIVVTASPPGFRGGTSDNTTKFLIQSGELTFSATGIVNSTVNVTFPTAFSGAPKVFVIPSSDSNAGGPIVIELTSKSNSGFGAIATIAAGDIPNAKILNAVPCDWIAFGPVTVE